MRTLFFRNQVKGFTLLELVVVLGISGLIFGGLWGLLTSGSQQLQAQSAAQQYRQVIDATRRLLTPGVAVDGSGANDFDPATYSVDTPAALSLAVLADTQIGLLSSNFAQLSGGNYYDAFGHRIAVMVTKLDTSNQKWRFMVYSTRLNPSGATVDAISDKAGAQISALIGSEGGFIYSADTEGCLSGTAAANKACGTFNSFAIAVADMGVANGAGRMATLSYTVDNSTSSAPWLMRLYDSTGGGFNTMSADLDFKTGNNPNTAAPYHLRMRSGIINMGAADADTNATGALNMNGAAFSMRGGIINMDTTGSSTCPVSTATPTFGCSVNMVGGLLNMNTANSTTGGGTLNMAAGSVSNLGGTSTCPVTGGWGTACQLSGGNVRMGFNSLVMTSSNSIDVRLGPTFALNIRNEPSNTATVVLGITGAGRADTFQAGQFIYSTSDMRLKHNVRTIPNALERVLALRGVNYDWKTNEAHDVGLLAQDVEKVFPELVSQIDGNKGIDYGKMVAPLVEAIRQLKQENDALRTKLDAMEKRLPAEKPL